MSAFLLLQLVLTGTRTHYEQKGLIDDKRLEHLLIAGKQVLYKSHQESDVRSALGFNPRVWEGLTGVLTVALPALERQSFAGADGTFADRSSDVIAAHFVSLVKDIERLNDLCTIARNLLATTKKAQNLASEKGFDQQILKLIDVCVRVTARGYDGDQNQRNEDRWQKVVNLYKRLLITCLQFLHNLIMHNEQRKLVLWLDLFGQSQADELDDAVLDEPPPVHEHAHEHAARVERLESALESWSALPKDEFANVGVGYDLDDLHALFDLLSSARAPDFTQGATKTLMNKVRRDMETLSGLPAHQLNDNPNTVLELGAALRSYLPARDYTADAGPPPTAEAPPPHGHPDAPDPALANGAPANGQALPRHWETVQHLASYGGPPPTRQDLTDEDLTMPRTSQSAAATLQEAKNELMARLHEPGPGPGPGDEADRAYDDDGHAVGGYNDELVGSGEESLEDDEEDDEDDDDDDDDYGGAADQERGLLTDVPLVLGPTEIEALPMIIQAGIVDSFGPKTGDRQHVRNMQAVRCHILLAQEAGRNVLRELLIFIAAWDLPDDEFYFKMMVQIMEAILRNGLMSHAYADFGQPKDIISPAQAVVIKILTHIFRAKYSPSSGAAEPQDRVVASGGAAKPRVPAALSRIDVLTVRYIFIVFRGNIIPETCALIYLQGQIRTGLALAEDFPLNLWDMERVYEGVYQFLEFFAVLTENNEWKQLLVEWEIVYDLVTLIKELDTSIAKMSLTESMTAAPSGAARPNGNGDDAGAGAASGASPPSPAPRPAPVAVERPYDPSDVDPVTQVPALGDADPPAQSPSPPAVTEEPADFEWRNLKKLIILVLSSLVWKSPKVQNQIREHGGVETIMSCTQYDACNPYIKEHAVMCLKFLLESNEANQQLVRELEPREVQTDATWKDRLDQMGVEIVMGDDGKPKVERRNLPWMRKKEAAAEQEAQRADLAALVNGKGVGDHPAGDDAAMADDEEDEEVDDDDDDGIVQYRTVAKGKEREGPMAGAVESR